jgi:PKD repeat protein
MKRRGVLHALVLAVFLLIIGTHVSAAPQPGRVHFTAAGDFSSSGNASSVLNAIDSADSDLTVALGDLSYGTTGQEQAWCDFVTSRVGAGYPFELISGNHESNGQNGNINDFSACLPNQLPGVVGTYGRQYYVDVPADDPVVRFVMISPNLPFPDGTTWSYAAGTPRYTWTAQAIDGARTAQIPWVVVGMHKPCISVGQYTCEPGADIFNLLLNKKVDLILSGHEHGYMRSHQLALGAGCTTFAPGTFDVDCRADNDDAFTQGRGSVVAVVGTGGVELRDVNNADTEANYFDVASGSNASPSYGALDVTATADSLQASFLRASGSLTDTFSITRDTTPNTPPTASFTSSCTNLSCDFNAAASSDPDGTIASYAWDFGDGTPAGSGVSPSHTYASANTYTVQLTVTDDDGATASTTRSVPVTAPPGPTTYVNDQFSRTVTGGWGSAPTGGAWTVTSTASNYAVNGSAGTITDAAGATRTAYLASVSAPAADAVVSVGLDKMPTGSGIYLSTYPRRITGQGTYAAETRVTSTGSVSLELSRTNSTGAETVISAATTITGLTYALGDKLTVRVQAVGSGPTTVRAKVWKTGTAEPTAWQKSVTDSTAGLQAAGHVGFSSYLSSSATNGPITVAVDSLVVTAP